MPSVKSYPVILALLLVLGACRKPVNVSWDVDMSIPVINSELDIRNFFGDTLISSDAQSLLHLSLKREVYSLKLDSLFQVPDTSIVNTFTVPALQPTILQPGQVLNFFPPSELTFKFGGENVALKRFDVRSGLLSVKFSNDLSQPLDLIYVIPNAVRNGQALTLFETIPPGVNSLIKSYDLAGYEMNLRGLSGNKYNTISQAYTLSVNSNASPVVVTYGKGAKAELNYTSIVPQYIEGYFGQQNIKIDLDTARFDIGKTFRAKNFMLNEATMNFYLYNEIGAEFSGSLWNIHSINSLESKTVTLGSNQLSSINLNRASKSGSEVFPSIKPIYFNKNNSNVAAFISNLPDKISYQGSVQLNPLGNISGYNDFAFYNTGIRILSDIDIPLKFTADYFILSSNFAFEITNQEQLDKVNSGEFIVYAENGFPFEAKIQAYLKDESGKVLDSLFSGSGNSIQAGLVNAQNEVISATNSKINVPIDKIKIDALKKTRSVEIRSFYLMPPNPPLIQLYERYKLKVKIVAELGYKIEV